MQRGLSVLLFGTDSLSSAMLSRFVRASPDIFNKAKLPIEQDVFVPKTPLPISRLGVVCPPDRPQGRGRKLTPVEMKQAALEHCIEVFEAPPKTMKGWEVPPNFDLGVVVSFGYFIPSRIISAFPMGCINLHPSMLPSFRGAAPIQRAILSGQRESGVSIIHVHPKEMDAGDLLWQEPMEIFQDDTFDDVMVKVKDLGFKGLSDVIVGLPGSTQSGWAQTGQVTMAPKIDKDEGIVQFAAQKADDIFNRWRALFRTVSIVGQVRHCKTHKEKGLVLERLCRVEQPPHALVDAKPPNWVYSNDLDCIVVKCMSGFVGIRRLRVQGKASVTAEAFARGHSPDTWMLL